MKKNFTSIFFLFLAVKLFANCECIDCPFDIPPVGIDSSQLSVSGATNNILGQNGQRLRAVHLNFLHDGIGEIELTLKAPNGSTVTLINQSFLAQFNRNNTFDICFVDCDEPVDPHPGTSENFDATEFNVIGQSYSGVYYPSSPTACLGDLTGSVNGIWTLIWDDWLIVTGGTLFEWSLEFEDNSGTECEPSCLAAITCNANGGSISPLFQTFCEGSPGLNFNIPPDFGGNVPNPDLYDYYYLITDENDVIIDYLTEPNLTGFSPGTYNICGVSVLIDDFSLLPAPNGLNNINDIQVGIDDELFCADLSDFCRTVIIITDDSDPQISGPDTVCVNELVTFTLEGLPTGDWTSGSVEGPFLNLEFNLPDIEVAWAPGSDIREICYSFSNVCTTGTVCKEVFIIQPPVFSISGPLEVCEGVTYFYEIDPPAPAGTSWDVTLTGGNVISVSNDGFEAEWFENGGSNFGVIVLTGGPCGDSPPNTISVELVSVDVPDLILPDELCIDDEGSVSVPFDPLVDDYFWSGNGITILSGQGTNGPVAFSVDQLGVVEVCLDIITSCGAVDPVCETINVIEPPSPEITAVDPQCEFEFTFIADIGAGSTGQWTQSGGPGGVDIISPQNSSTDVVVSESGVYIFEFTEDNGSCEGSTEIEVEILPSPEVEEGDIFCAGGEYEVELIISGGAEPYFVDGVEISGTLFLSDPINSGDPYFFIITDSNGCEAIAEGLIECPCVADAGTMSAEQINICISSGQPATGIHNGDATFDINDIGVFILHDNPGTTLGNIIEINDTGVFNFQAGIVPGQTYYISYVVGLEDNGFIDLSDPCLSVAFGQEVIFYEDPIAEIISPQEFCQGNGTLEADLSPDVTQISWTQTDGPATANILNPNLAFTQVIFDEAGIYVFELTVSNPACELVVEWELEVFANPIILDLETECLNLNEYILSVEIESSVQIVNISIPGELDGSAFTSDVLDPNQVYILTVEDENGCITEIQIDPVDCFCLNERGTMESELLSACLSSGDSITVFYNNDGVFQTGDIGMYYLHDNPGIDLGIVFATNDSPVFGFVDGMVPGQVYYVSFVIGREENGSIDETDECLKVAIGQPVVFYEDPEITVDYDDSYCGFSALLTAGLDPANEIIEWRYLSGPGNGVFSAPFSSQTVFDVDQPGQYQIEVVIENPACISVDTIEVAFNLEPIAVQLETECVASGLFIISFEIEGSGEDFSINLPGTISGNEFVSDTLEAEIQYVFTITDELGCSTEFSVDPVFCNCLSSSGTMSGDSIVICETELSIDLDFNFDADVFPGDTAVFIIHEGDGQELINPVFITNSLAFSIPDTLQRDQWYFISHVSGSQNTEGIDLDDPCLDISVGQPLFIYSVPTFELPEDRSICLQDLIVDFIGDGLYELIENSNDVNVNFVFQNDSLSIQTDAASVLVFEYTETNGLCEATDSLRIEFFEPPFVENIETTCIADQFFGSFEISGGNSPYFVNGTEIDGDFFITDTVMSETVITFEVVDNNGCSAAIVELTEDCACIARTGEFQIDELELCEGEDIELAALDLQGTIDDEDFELFFVLHDGDANDVGNILAASQGDPIEWSAGFELGRAYFITAIISTSEEGEINFDDPCIDFSVGIPVVWVSGPNVEISGSIEICLGEDLFLTVESEGPFPFNIELNSSAGDTIDVEITEANQQVNLPQNAGETIWEINAVVSECDGIFSGEFIAIVSEPLELNFFTAPLICNNALFGSILDLNELIIGGTIDGTWIFDGEEVLDGVIDFDGFDPGQYEFFFSTEGFEDPCPGNNWLVLIDVIGCDCPPVSLPTALRICSDFDPIPLMDISGEAVEGVWTLNNPNSNNPVPVIEDGFLITDLAVSGVFELIFTVTDSLPEECTSEYTVILEIEEFRSAGEVIGSPVELCESESNEVNLFDYLTGFSEGGVWLDENREIIGGIVDLSDSDLPLNTFYYLVEGEGLCSSDEVEVNIALLSAPEYEIITINPTCAGENNGSIIVENLDSENPITIAFLDGNAVTADDLTLLSAGTYTLQLVGANGCSGVVEVIEIIDPPQYNLSLGDDLELDFLETTTIEFTTDIPDSLVSSIFWSDDSGIIAENTPQITFVAETETTISVLLISVDNCILEDELRIFLGEKDIYLPNVFRPASDIEANARFGPLGTQSIEQINQFSIFDRWGNRVHEVKDLAPDHPAVFWDGRIDGQNAHEAVYVYQLIYVDFRGATIVKAGDFVLLR
ncbi:MAG: hypothetical protein EA362_03635 [Saprospirales bacterium]|nr:MAG: hypothetical protein EA362_03635 [Saprospirales bacterium]